MNTVPKHSRTNKQWPANFSKNVHKPHDLPYPLLRKTPALYQLLKQPLSANPISFDRLCF